MKKFILMLVLGAIAAASQATLYKYDGFEYVADTGLRYQSGYAATGVGGMPTNRAGSLTYPGLPASTGGKLQVYGQKVTGIGTVNYKMWSAGVPGGATQTNLFASFILNVANVGTIQSNQYIFAIRNATGQIMITNNASNPSKYNIGIFQQGGKTVWAWDSNGGNGYDINTSYFIVVSYIKTAAYISQVWVNPAMGSATPDTPKMEIPEIYNSSPTNQYSFCNGNGNVSPGTEIYVDELRVGSTWADVTPGSASSSYTLTGSAVGKGTVSPANTYVAAGDNADFVITAANYYRIALLTTNGTPVGISFDNNSTYTNFTWSNVQTSGALVATFTAQTASDPGGTPHWWLAQYGLTDFDADAASDQDLDGFSAWQEYIAGTNPTNTASSFRVLESPRDVLNWNAVSGRLYSVYWTTNLMSGFESLASDIPAPRNSYTNETAVTLADYQIKVRMDSGIKIDPGKKCQTIEGWGASLCWWAHRVGQWNDDAKIDEIVDLITSPDKLNMNIFRYNIGGGDDPSHYSTLGTPGHMALGKGIRAEMEGFRPGKDDPYDWTADAGQRKILLKIKAKRPDAVFEAFANSPPYWMTYSGCSAGNNPGSSDNLKPEFYGPFCDYLIEVCKHYKETYGIEFKTLEPFNESLVSYWIYLGSQEGCHFNLNSQINLLRALYPKLQASGLNTVISASDETSLHDFITAMKGYINAGDITNKLGQINTHTYSGTVAERIEAQNLARQTGKTFWQSETGPMGISGSGLQNNIRLARRLFDDLRYMKPVAWLDWQMMDESNDAWSQLTYSFTDETFWIVKNFYVRMQVTRFIKQGYTLIETESENVLAALSPQNNELVVIVINNSGGSQSFDFDLSGFSQTDSSAKTYRTSSAENCKEISGTAIIQNKMEYLAPDQTITTLVLPVRFPD